MWHLLVLTIVVSQVLLEFRWIHSNIRAEWRYGQLVNRFSFGHHSKMMEHTGQMTLQSMWHMQNTKYEREKVNRTVSYHRLTVVGVYRAYIVRIHSLHGNGKWKIKYIPFIRVIDFFFDFLFWKSVQRSAMYANNIFPICCRSDFMLWANGLAWTISSVIQWYLCCLEDKLNWKS